MVIDFVVQRLSPYTSTASPFIWAIFLALKKVHSGWRWYRRFHLYTQQQSWTQLLAGSIVTSAARAIPLIEKTSQAFHVTTRALETSQQMVNTSRAFQKWLQVIRGEYCSTKEIQWAGGKVPYLSPSTAYWIALKKAQLSDRVEKIALATWGLASAFGTLCMKIMDVYDAAYPEEDSRFDATQEVFVNMGKWLDVAVENKQAMMNAWKKNQPVFNYILAGTGMDIASALPDALKKAETLQRSVKNFSVVNLLGRSQPVLTQVNVEIK